MLRCEALESRELLSTYYASFSSGLDTYDGLYPDHSQGGIHGPWKTIGKVDSASLVAGDSVLFARGDTWRDSQLCAKGGSSGSPITYGAYGTGAKPLFLGSVEQNSTADWIDKGNNIWSTKPAVQLVTTSGNNLITNGTFESNGNGWTGFKQSPASTLTYGRYTSDHQGSGLACYRLKAGSNNGDSWDDIALRTTASMSITAGQYYLLDFWAKTDSAFSLNSIQLHKSGTPGTSYTGICTSSNFNITTGWTEYKVLFQAASTQTDAVLSFYMGDLIPGNKQFLIDNVSFKVCSSTSGQQLPGIDVGNIVFNNGESCGVKRWVMTDGTAPLTTYNTGLHNQGDFFYDASDWTVKVYSSNNPATHYSDTEMALGYHIVSMSTRSYITCQNLDLRYGGSHGISSVDGSYITVSDCDMSFIGGALMGYDGNNDPIRYGNGVDLYGDVHDILVERCKITDIYDSGLTNQSMRASTTQTNLVYRNNIIRNCEISYEFSMGSGDVHDVIFECNTCVYAGYGWGHPQRPDPSGYNFYSNNASHLYWFYLYNNIFSAAAEANIGVKSGWNDLANLYINYNLYNSPIGVLAEWQGTSYAYDQFAQYKAATGQDANSIVAPSGFVDGVNGDFHLLSGSAAIDTGLYLGNEVTDDYDLIGRPQGGGYDMGAFEYHTSGLAMSGTSVVLDGSATAGRDNVARRRVFHLLGDVSGNGNTDPLEAGTILEDVTSGGVTNTLAHTLVSRRVGRKLV